MGAVSVVKQEETPVRSLVTKLAEVMGEVQTVGKRGRNAFHNYDYVTEADVAAAVRKGMASRHLILVPDVSKMEFVEIPSAKGAPQRLCTLTVKFTVKDGDSGEEFSFNVPGQGMDAGDKATNKAMTGAEKYALLKLFLISSGDDSEKESPEDDVAKGAPKAPSAPRAVPKAPEAVAAAAADALHLEDGSNAGYAVAGFTEAQLAGELRMRERWFANVKNTDPVKRPAVGRDIERLKAAIAARAAK